MIDLFKRVLYVSLSLRGPDSLPGSRGTLVLCLIPWVAVTVAGNLMQWPENAGLALAGTALELTLLFGYSRMVLRFAGKLERWPQTIVSLLGVQAVITALSLPVIYLATRQDPPGPLLQAVDIALIAWWVVAMANIFSKALDTNLGIGALLSVAQLVLLLMVSGVLFSIFGVLPGA